jgi:transcriptional regulator with XRE-family HTH domain
MDTVISMSGNARPKLRLKTEKFDELAAAVTGARTDRELADRLGVSYNHLSQVRNHHRTPGNQFIANVCTAMPNVRFEDLFETVEQVATGDAA